MLKCVSFISKEILNGEKCFSKDISHYEIKALKYLIFSILMRFM